VVVQHHHEVPTLYFLAPLVFNFSLVISQKTNNKKHENNKITKTFFTKNLDPKSSDLFIFILS